MFHGVRWATWNILQKRGVLHLMVGYRAQGLSATTVSLRVSLTPEKYTCAGANDFCGLSAKPRLDAGSRGEMDAAATTGSDGDGFPGRGCASAGGQTLEQLL